MERLNGSSDQAYFAAYSDLANAQIKLEEAVRQESFANRPGEIAAYDEATENVGKVVAALEQSLTNDKQMLELLDKYGPEPGFEQALHSLDTRTAVAKLVNAKIVPNRPEWLASVVERVKKEGSRGIVTGRMEGIEQLRAQALDFQKTLRDNRQSAVQGEIVKKIDGPGFAPVMASQQTVQLMAQNLAEACPTYSTIGKVARGTLGY